MIHPHLPEKNYYKIGEIAKGFDIKTSTIRYWEREIKTLQPKRNNKGDRRYTPEDIKKIGKVFYLIKVKGLTLEGVNAYFRDRKKVSVDMLENLHHIRDELIKIRDSL